MQEAVRRVCTYLCRRIVAEAAAQARRVLGVVAGAHDLNRRLKHDLVRTAIRQSQLDAEPQRYLRESVDDIPVLLQAFEHAQPRAGPSAAYTLRADLRPAAK